MKKRTIVLFLVLAALVSVALFNQIILAQPIPTFELYCKNFIPNVCENTTPYPLVKNVNVIKNKDNQGKTIGVTVTAYISDVSGIYRATARIAEDGRPPIGSKIMDCLACDSKQNGSYVAYIPVASSWDQNATYWASVHAQDALLQGYEYEKQDSFILNDNHQTESPLSANSILQMILVFIISIFRVL